MMKDVTPHRHSADPGWQDTPEWLSDEVETGGERADASTTLPLIDFSGLSEEPAPREFGWGKWIPRRQTTLLTGEGGVGKSLLAQQLATCTALGLPFLGMETRMTNAIYITVEDDPDELERRQWAICRTLGVPIRDIVGRLFLSSLAGELDTALAVFDESGRVTTTDRWRAFRDTAAEHDIGFAAFDNATDMMAGDHNDLHQVATFVNLLTGFAIEHNAVALLLHHPNKGGADWLGSVAWHNKVRSRLFVKRAESGDPDCRTIENPKANYGPSGSKIEFRWHEGGFVRDNDLPDDTRCKLDELVASNGENAAFLACLRERVKQHRAVSEQPAARTYAPKVFAAMPECKGLTLLQLERAMERLFRIGAIERGQLWKGEDRKMVVGLREVGQAGAGDLGAAQ